MFRGRFAHGVDQKGRVSVPAKFRDLILASNDDRVMVTNFRSKQTPCLDVYPYAAWLRLEERMNQRPQFNPKVQAFTTYGTVGVKCWIFLGEVMDERRGRTYSTDGRTQG